MLFVLIRFNQTDRQESQLTFEIGLTLNHTDILLLFRDFRGICFSIFN